MKPGGRQLHEVTIKRKLLFNLLIKETKFEDPKAIIKTKDSLYKEQKWRMKECRG
jgi:hypothetical protein